MTNFSLYAIFKIFFINSTNSFHPRIIDIIVETKVNKLIIPPNILNIIFLFILVKLLDDIKPILCKISNGIPNITFIPHVKS